jgi:hypothetical protein
MTKGCHVIDNVCVNLVGRIWSPNGNINYLFICKGLHEDVTEFHGCRIDGLEVAVKAVT